MSHKRRSRLRNVAEYATIRGIEYAMAALPVRWALACGRGVGLYIRLWDKRHRVVAEENVRQALGLGDAEARAFVRRVYSNLGATFVEGLIIPHILRRHRLEDFCQFEGEDHLRAALDRGRGAILVTAHLGNWELGGFVAARVAGSVMAVARPMDNPLLEKNARRLRQRMGQTIVDRGRGGLRAAIQRLKQGGLVAMLIDQNHRKGPVFVPFFGRRAATVPSPAALALKYDVPVLPGYAWRDRRRFRHYFRCEPPFELIRTGDHKA
ncbi:MAG: lysophospholipid acyltransferase family protein, partial [Planctomycetota bacterium]